MMTSFPKEYIYDEADVPAQSPWTMESLLESLRRNSLPRGFQEFFDRDPERVPPADGAVVVSPADGILEIKPRAGKIEYIVHMRLTDVHVQRIPLAGTVVSVESQGADFYYPDDADYWLGVRAVTTIQSCLGPYVVRQMTTLITKRIETCVKPGESVSLGQRLGRIRLGSTVTLLLPESARPAAFPGRKVRAGETILARYD
ncbi:MAG: phosphatidylserine decarboxylase [Elusimicrobia bacterium]|nr:phosphatidylserine decarboxylase [Elusimicrobiota bacterium]